MIRNYMNVTCVWQCGWFNFQTRLSKLRTNMVSL